MQMVRAENEIIVVFILGSVIPEGAMRPAAIAICCVAGSMQNAHCTWPGWFLSLFADLAFARSVWDAN